MQLKKITAGLLSVLLAGALLAGCSTGETASSNASQQPASSAAAEKTKVNVFGIKGPTGIGLVNLMKANEEKTAQNDWPRWPAAKRISRRCPPIWRPPCMPRRTAR